MAVNITQMGRFLAEDLTHYDRNIIDTVYPEYWGFEGKYHVAVADLPIATRKLVYGRIDHTGRAVNFGGKAMDIPLANFGITADENQVVMGVLGAEWSAFDLEAEKLAKESGGLLSYRNTVQEFYKAMDKGLREWMHIRTLFGDPDLAFRGLFNPANVEIIDINTQLTALPPEELYNFMKGIMKDFRKSNKLTAEATDLLLNEDLRDALTNRFTDGSVDGNPFKMLTNPVEGNQIRVINSVNELEADTLLEYGVLPNANKDMFMLYELDAETLDRHFTPIERTEPMLKDDGFTYRVTGYCATSEVRSKRPFRVKIYTYLKA